MKWSPIVVLLAGLAFAAPASAQFYKYLDKQGNIRFTDDINQVPENQRNRIRSYAAASPDVSDSTSSVDGAGKKTAGPDAPDAASVETAPGASGDEESLDGVKARLEEMKKRIDSDYRALAGEKDALGKEKATPKTREQVADYNKRVEAFNQRAGDYEARSNELRKQVETYNARVVEENAKLTQSAQK